MNDVKEKISIIIPVYNTSAYLKKCLESVINQTYKNLEIILVNDSSTDNSKEIIEEYIKKDNRIKCIEHEKNKGLFHARITGANNATGKYIAFLDSDDYLSVDYYRTLIYNAEENQSDMVFGNTILEYDNGEKIVYNLSDINFKQLTGDQILNSYFKQEGLNFSWHTVWNKLYNKSIWDKAHKHFEEQTKHLIMTEDFAFSTVFFFYAKKITRVENDGLFYCKHDNNASTSLNNLTFKKFNKNLQDLITSFSFVEEFMKKVDIYEKYKENFIAWKCLYKSQQQEFKSFAKLDKAEKKEINNKLEEFCDEDKKIENGHYFSTIQLNWNEEFENIKKQINSKEIEIVSFDIFDTLVVRPFLEPSDLFIMMDEYFRELTNHVIDFSKIRIESERLARELQCDKKTDIQEVTLDYIYDVIREYYHIDKNILDKLKQKELELELRFCYKRKSAYELYQLAVELGKKVICTSDMYLPIEEIEAILNKNGYTKIEKIYLSSECKKTKWQGNLYKHVLNDLQKDAKQIIHIGDNKESDYMKAKEIGIKAIHYPRTINLFLEKSIGQVFTKDLPDWQDNISAFKFLGIRCMVAVVANKYFDNPYIPFKEDSDFNGDPFLIGYFAFGMHLYSVAKWLLDSVTKNKYDKIVFMARDGYWPMQAYKIMKQTYENAPEEDYVYVSRRALIPIIIQNDIDFYKLPEIINIYEHTPRQVLGYIEQLINKNYEKIEQFCKKEKIDINKKFKNIIEFNKFAKIIIDNFYNKEKHQKDLLALKKYFSKIYENKSCNFDIGYSARPEMYISKLCNKGIDTYFININHEEAYKYAQIGNFKLETFFDYKPTFTGLVRELLFSVLTPSCIGYQIENENVKPIFEEDNKNYQTEFVLGTIQNSAIEFVEDMVKIFGKDIKRLYYQKYYASIPQELYIQSPKYWDRKILEPINFEDTVLANERVAVTEQWEKEMNWHNQHTLDELWNKESFGISRQQLLDRSLLVRITYYILFDRITLRGILKTKLENHKFLYKTAQKSYSILRRIKKIIKRS